MEIGFKCIMKDLNLSLVHEAGISLSCSVPMVSFSVIITVSQSPEIPEWSLSVVNPPLSEQK